MSCKKAKASQKMLLSELKWLANTTSKQQ